MANTKSLKMVSTTVTSENRARYYDLGERTTDVITGYFYDPGGTGAVHVLFFYDGRCLGHHSRHQLYSWCA